MAITLSLTAAGIVLLPPRASRGEGAGRAVSARAVAVGSTPRTPERRRYFDSRGRSRSKAIGRAARGLLRNAVGLDDSPTLFVKASSVDHRFGTFELVEALRAAAETVAASFPGSRLIVGDISRRGGGRIRPHRSHRRGLDADVGFYVMDEHGAPLSVRAFVRMDADGVDKEGSGARFDTARNWALVGALLEQPHARVQYLFVARHLERLLLEHAQSIGASAELVAAATEALYQGTRGRGHDNHFHVRFYCAADDRPACVDQPPFHPWYDGGDARPTGNEGSDDEAKR